MLTVSEGPINLLCPMYGRQIEIGLCMEAQDVVDDMITQPPEPEYYIRDEMKPICRECPKRDDPRA